jgi:hypothetical protein
MDLTQLLRSQARRYKCSVCQENMADCEIDVLAHQGNRALVKVTCIACKDENLLQIIFQTEGEGDGDGEGIDLVAEPRPKLFDEPRPPIHQPISADDMLELHNALGNVRGGGFRDLVTPHR